jgi:CxxC-x17-CxxC domain-containing protein
MAGSMAPRTMYPAICSSCGVETTVPFEPISGKPVQCRSCFQPKPRI